MMYLVYVYVPESHLEELKGALFAAGGGRIGNYDSCSWQTAGEGQFRPLEGSDPYSGRKGEVSREREYRLELTVPGSRIREVLSALKEAHPYEEPAYGAVEIAVLEDFPEIAQVT